MEKTINIAPKNVLVWKMDTGEEVVGALVKTNADAGTLTVDQPRAIAVMPARNGQMGMTLVPFMASNQEGEVDLVIAHVVAYSKPAEDLEKGYLQSTTKIQLV